MSAETVIQRAKRLGVTLTVVEDRIRCSPKSAVPPDFIEVLRLHKSEVIERLRRQAEDNLSKRYQQMFQGEGLINEELAEIRRRVEADGYVLCHSVLFDDFVAFHR